MKNKNLITDILTYLKENDEARERFGKLPIIKDEMWVSIDFGGEIRFATRFFKHFKKSEIQTFLIHALSSPQGKPICGFLKFKEMEDCGCCFKWDATNHASTLFSLLTSQIEKGKSFDEILIKLNKKYNEIN